MASQLDQLAEELHDAGVQLRELAHGIYPGGLAEDGLESALRVVASRSPLPTVVQANRIGRYHPDVELNVYYCCHEGLQNAIKHAGSAATVTIGLIDGGRDGLRFEIHDNGRGCDSATILAGHGFINISDRLAAIGGTLNINAQAGSGVSLHGHVRRPLRSGRPSASANAAI